MNSKMITGDIQKCLKKLRLNNHIGQMSEKIKAESNQEYLLKLLEQEVGRREETNRQRLIKAAGFYTIKSFEAFRFD